MEIADSPLWYVLILILGIGTGLVIAWLRRSNDQA